MVPICRDENSTPLVGTDLTQRLYGEINFIPARWDKSPPSICLDLFKFYFNFPLQERVKLLFHPA